MPDVTDTAVLALSSRVIDAEAFDRPQSNRPWGGSEVRAWLNGRFAEAAFTEEERNALLITGTGDAHYDKAGCVRTNETVRDRVFLLSAEECRRYLDVLWYGPDSLREKYSFRTRAPYTAYALAFSEAYDESECFNLCLIPESYDLVGSCGRETTVWSWPHTDDYEWHTDKNSRIAIWVSPDSGALAWQIDNALYYWHAPFVSAEDGRPTYVRMTARIIRPLIRCCSRTGWRPLNGVR